MKTTALLSALLVGAAASVAGSPVEAEADAVLNRVSDALAAAGVPPAAASEPDVVASPALVEERAEELAGLRVHAKRGHVVQPTAEPRFRERRFISKLVKTAKGLWDKKEYLQRKLAGDKRVNYAQQYEDCMGCRLVWKQVEMDVSNARYIEDVQASFEHNCMDMQKTNIFYKVCEDMYDDMYAMTDDYMSNKYTVDQMCIRAKMCRL